MTNLQKNKKQEKIILEIPETVVVKDLAEKMNIKATDLIAELIKNKIFASINETIDFDTAAIVADDFGFELRKQKPEIEKRKEQLKKDIGAKAKKRPPVVAIMGHVDHGKTTLLDKILKTKITAEEYGGITQYISAYQVKRKGETITFLDTPGHEAFQAMRQRGAYITDLALIVVAADDGVKPQTIEAVNFARSAKVPIVVAINKIDKPQANIEKVKGELAEIGLTPEEWGGETICVNISAKTGEGIDELLDTLILVSEMEELKADYDSLAEGFVIESHLDSKSGPVVTVLVQNGTLKEGSYINAESFWGRIRKMEDFTGKKIKRATPSTPATIIGLNGVPKAGSFFSEEPNRLLAEEKARKFSALQRGKSLETGASNKVKVEKIASNDLPKKLDIIVKADTKGSLEAVKEVLKSIGSDKAIVRVLKTDVGNITETDIKLAHSFDAKIIGFNIGIDPSIRKFAEKRKVDLKIHNVIYDLIADIKKSLSSIIEPEIVRIDIGTLKVIAIFRSAKKSATINNMIIGAKVEDGKVEKASLIDVFRKGKKIGQGVVKELQYNRKEVQEVKVGNNAGITYEGDVAIKIGDILKAYKEEEVKEKI